MFARRPFVVLSLSLCLSLAAASAQARGPRQQQSGQPGVFDYYALALSWAPNFCASHDDPHQCAPGRQYGFLVHGLWPQYDKGYPQSCSSEPLTPALQAKYAPVYAAPGLIKHEWAKHGTCSGLAPADYFELTAKLQRALAIPPAYQRPATPLRQSYAQFGLAFQTANPGLPTDSVLPFCSDGGRFLREARACFGKSGRAQQCSAAELKASRKSCGQDSFLLQNVR